MDHYHTPADYVAGLYPADVDQSGLYLHAVDCLQWLISCRPSGQDGTRHGTRPDRHAQGILASFRAGLGRAVPDIEAARVIEAGARPRAVWAEQFGEDGQFDTDAYLDHEYGRPVRFFRSMEPRPGNRPILNILLDIQVAHSMRSQSYMQYRHSIAYKAAIECENQGRPCRIEAVRNVYDECLDKYLRQVIVIKADHEPIFPGIWSVFSNNPLTNDFRNALSDYLLGNPADGNGQVRGMDLADLPLFADRLARQEDFLLVTGGPGSSNAQDLTLSGQAIQIAA